MRRLFALGALVLLAHLVLFSGLPLVIRALAALLIVGLGPAALLVSLLVGSPTQPTDQPESLLLTVGAAFATTTLGMLVLSYLPGGIAAWQVLLFYDAAMLLMVALHWWRTSRVDPLGNSEELADVKMLSTQSRKEAKAQSIFLMGVADKLPGEKRSRTGSDDFSHAVKTTEVVTAEFIVQDKISTDSDGFSRAVKTTEVVTTVCPTPAEPVEARNWLLAGVLALLLVGGFYRFMGLGYAEFHGDEARAVLRATAVVQGHEEALFIHRKGPLEILIPAAIIALTGQIDELTARLPFAIAGLAALFAIFGLGWRSVGGAPGWVGAMLLAINGYFIAFSRFVQYQSVVILATALVLLLLVGLLQGQPRVAHRLLLAALLAATALLAHYDALAVAPPALLLLVALIIRSRQQTGERRQVVIGIGWAAAFGAAVLALYYVPFVLHPNFGATVHYLLAERITGEGSPPFNTLPDFFLRGALYNSAAQMVVLIVGALTSLCLLFWRGYGRVWGAILAAAAILLVALTALRVGWLHVGSLELTFVPFTVLLLLACIAPGLRVERRAIWLWFAAPFVIAIFFTAFARTHVHLFFAPLALLVGEVIALAWQALTQRLTQRTRAVATVVAVACSVLLLGVSPYWLFVYNRAEVLRTWPQDAPNGVWMPGGVVSVDGRFGFPFTNGWKVVGALYDQGILSGDYETNQRYMWIPSWYARGGQRCWSTAEWYFAVDNLEPWMETKAAMADRLRAQGFDLWGVVTVNDAERMQIYRNTAIAGRVDDVQRFSLEEMAGQFDARTGASLKLPWPIISSVPQHPLHINFGNELWLEGYTIGAESVAVGHTMPVTLYWRAQRPLDVLYTVSLQSYYGDGVKVAQTDAMPACDREPTTGWSPGEVIEDVHNLPVSPDAPPGAFPLYVGLYDAQTGQPLPVLDSAGNPVGSQFQMSEIEIE